MRLRGYIAKVPGILTRYSHPTSLIIHELLQREWPKMRKVRPGGFAYGLTDYRGIVGALERGKR